MKSYLTKNLFGKVGIEPTFFPDLVMPPFVKTQEHMEKYRAACSEIIRNSCLGDLPKNVSPRVEKWIENHEPCEGGGVELPTPHEYINDYDLVEDYKELLSVMEKCSFKPSSLICMDTEGGCHINISTDRVELEGIDEHYFVKNLMAFTNSYPSLVWMNLSPNDNESAIITYKNTRTLSKGDCINDRTSYMELRFFMMPRTVEEFIWHLEVANNVMWYVFEETKQKRFISFKNTSKANLLKYTKLETCIKDAEEGLRLIGCEPARAERVWKFEELEQRVSYGKYYLI